MLSCARMALTLIPPTSGSVQGVTYSHNRGGAYTRKRATPVVGTRTTRQGVVKGNMTVASQAWQLLSVGDQNAWISYANGHPVINRLGSSIKLTGSQYFIKCAAALLNAGEPLPTLPPVSTTIQPVVLSDFEVNDSPSMSLTLTPGTAGDFILVAVSKWSSAGVNFNKTFSQVTVVPSDTATIDVMDAWIAFAGNPAIGQKAWMRLTPVNAGGLTGSPLYIQTPIISNASIPTPVATSPVAAQLTLTWTGGTGDSVEWQTGPAPTGPFGAITNAGVSVSPKNIGGLTTGDYGRGRLLDATTLLAGPWSNAIQIT